MTTYQAQFPIEGEMTTVEFEAESKEEAVEAFVRFLSSRDISITQPETAVREKA